ncbi:hypothetical protein D8674_028791 [Pyrus ussuriensis x Pyrus communis]|uniref:Uncharacterized protein n=1 Tax=Pyrus ussuriensis x Pyrus communis TaxID=2448454 RepID=A0A5N5IAS0_9ROSA|nr:hypothetical protein D8674_028791 [Pyrus ussuriensis x Pyrus communis]
MATQVDVPPSPFPQRLQEDISVNVLGEVHTYSTLSMLHGQLFSQLNDLDTGQMVVDGKILVAVLDSAPTQPIILDGIRFKSYKQTMIHMETKKKLNGNPILRQEIRPKQKLWVLNT